jgi:histidinol-phosphate aminotransferase
LGYQPHDSWANFVLFGGVSNPQATFDRLLEHDILIRDVGLVNHLRVTAGTPAETTEFLEALARLAR